MSNPTTPSAISRVRRRLGRLRKTRMMVRDVRKRVDAQRAQADLQRKQLEAQSRQQTKLLARLDAQAKQVEAVKKSVAVLTARLTPFEQAAALRELEHGRFGYQLGAVEERLGTLEQRITDGTFVTDDAGQAQARDLVEAVRREHAQIRVRMQIVSAYEERLRRVEATVVALYDGDHRHPV